MTSARWKAKAPIPMIATDAIRSHHKERVHETGVTLRPVNAFSEFGFVGMGRLSEPGGAVPTPAGVSVAVGTGDGVEAGAGVCGAKRTMCGGVAVCCAAGGFGDGVAAVASTMSRVWCPRSSCGRQYR